MISEKEMLGQVYKLYGVIDEINELVKYLEEKKETTGLCDSQQGELIVLHHLQAIYNK